MSSSKDPTIRAIAFQQANQPSYPQNDSVDAIMQSLLLENKEVTNILKGDIQQPIDNLNRYLEMTRQGLEVWFKENPKMMENTELAAKLYEIRELFKAIHGEQQVIEKRLARYYNKVPYLFEVSSMMKLSNVSEKEAQLIMDEQDLMILNDKANSIDDEDFYEDTNWYMSIRHLMHMAVRCSINGFMLRNIVEERKTITNYFPEMPGQRKKRFGVF